jgi:formate-dependent nitrite reductase membrane component NrfD
VARENVMVRKPEQGTAPKLFYINADEITLTPTAAQANQTFMWAEVVSEQHIARNGHSNGHHPPATTRTANSGAAIRTPAAQGLGYRGPIHVGEGRIAEQMVQTGYNAQHKIPWHWPVPAYLVTKGLGSGMFALLAIFFGLNIVDFSAPLALLGNFAALLFIGLTTLLLVIDLEKPLMFYTILTRPQMKSWLTRGAFILIGFTTVAGLWLALEGGAWLGFLPAGPAAAARLPLLVIGFVLALGAAVYTAFLFGQAEGRDLWQSSLLPAHLLIQAFMVGSGALLALGLLVDLPALMAWALVWIFGVALAVDLLVTLLGEFGMPHASEIAARAAHDISSGKYKHHFWWGSVVVGHLVPLALLLAAAGEPVSLGMAAVAALLAVIGLYLFEYAFVMAPQEIPNS